MKHFFAWTLAVMLGISSVAQAQVRPPAAPANLQGQPLKDWLRQNWYDGKRVVLSYNDARGKMYNYADNYQGKVTCVYSGYQETVRLDSSSTSTGGVNRINCEHTIPQSWFNEVTRMRSDMHHLFPTYDTWNSDRGSDPFAEIPDAQTTKWIRNLTAQATIPTSNIEEYSEDTNSLFEPREDHKGNVARCAFYFYTMHQGQTFDPGKDVITALANLNTLYQWHLADPVDARERERNRRVAKSQGNYNPYIEYPDLVARAWGFVVQPTFSFASATGSINEGNNATFTYTATINVTPAPTSPLTVQVAADVANSTASSPSDYTFSTQTLTFAAGQTSQTVTVTVIGDATPEADETVLLTLQNASTGGSIGGPAVHTLTITNDDGPAPTINFATATGAVNEGNTGTTTYSVNVALTGSAPSANLTVPVTVVATGTTADAADYTLGTATLSFVAGQSRQNAVVTITVNGDTQPEANETIRLRLGQPSGGGAVIGQPNEHILTVTNDDQAPVGADCSDLYFSEYVEAAVGNTKVVEIYNPTSSPISLTNIRVDLFANGATTPTSTAALSGTIAPGDVYVIANAGSAAAVLAQADLTSNITFFNGDDALALFDGTDTLDVIGVIGQQPTGGWFVTGGTTTNATLVRKPNVGKGQARWAQGSGTWQFVGTDVFNNVGSHTSTACNTTGTTKAAPLGAGIEVYPNPASGAVQVRIPGLSGRHQASIVLFNALGQQVREVSQPLTGADAATVSLQHLSAGLYSVRVTVDGVRYTSRVAVRP
ncbi:endonuclease [Hymenobacter sp. BT175]|uniref:endonuclease n=1 Tax=Hymenobacter translucens TaxID=2886507 RepID=UPI001D0E927D|nr:endonuclease [Hymenobacter translucens]MCC2548615.1 endonuclease [Hymenobacter translucens]